MCVSIPKFDLFCYVLSFALLFNIMLAVAQESPGKVTGRVVDENSTTLPFVQVTLKSKRDSGTVKAVLADDQGRFAFEITSGKYLIELKMMGYGMIYSKVFDVVGGQTTSLGTIRLNPVATQLANVNIAAALPFVERRADKLIVNLNGLDSGAPIMEVMNQLPGVVVTPDDRISLNGKSVQIYMDGKATTLSAEALAGLLKGISSSAIQKIELIAQPSAKYDAAGNGAIINIIRKRNYKAGLNGNIYAGGGKGTFGKANGGINLNYKGKAYNLLLNLDYNYNKYFYDSYIASSFYSAGIPSDQSISDIKSMRTNSNYTPNLGIDLYLTKRTTLSASVKPGFQNFNRDGVAYINSNREGEPIDQSQFFNLVHIEAANFSSGLRLQHQIDTVGRELTIDLDYYRYGNYNDQENRTFVFNPATDLRSKIAQDRVFDIYAFKMDYSHPFENGYQLEMGLKTSYVNSGNSNFFQDINGQQTDLFSYKELISATYLTYGHTGKAFSYQLGIRGEYTRGQGEQQFETNRFTRTYFQPFPSVHFDYKLAKNHNLSLGLNKRIERPGYESLNPLVRVVSSNNFQQGNPALRPVIAYNADLWYGYKNAFFLGLTYSYSIDDFTSLSIPLNDRITTTLPGNADYADYFTMQAMYGKQVLSSWYTSTNAILSKRSFKGEFNGMPLQSDGIASLSATSYNSLSLSKNFSVMFLFNYRGKSIDRTITNQAFAYLTAGVRQQFLNKRASVQLNFMDVFKSYRNYYQQNSGLVQQVWRNQFETRMVKLNLNYNFGGTIKNARKSDGADDEKKRSTLNEN
ncbi:outer membrane beta-barrel family protein [Pedobacter metabolipauper]|uniref:Outer membrane receptor protein involved in Fe transport n=1 Tax=Pedobacter metabolipauper TaxID=425513 RepID=A0A4R6SVH3_9SPHI|nr:outer membrane beta-barrel family protein [Pedobacter metabolipauper]TDQ08449.1 outer membrane receptor protein involved in Fe transport [Pedobacter metabolipauper]